MSGPAKRLDMVHVHLQVAEALGRLEALFTPEAKLSFVMHIPGNPDAVLFISTVSQDEVIEALQANRDRGTRAPTPTHKEVVAVDVLTSRVGEEDN